MNYQCFLVEKTGNTRTVQGTCPCTDPECANKKPYVEYEWRRTDTGEIKWEGPYSWGVGAMWLEEIWDIHRDDHGQEIARYKGNGDWNNDDGFHLCVMLPGPPDEAGKMWGLHKWDIDSRCGNCAMPDDRLHRCWVREGTPPNVTVGKAGLTCPAGAGSVRLDWWHGMLRNGILEEC